MTYSIKGEAKAIFTFSHNQDGTFSLYAGPAGVVVIQPENALGLAQYIFDKKEAE